MICVVFFIICLSTTESQVLASESKSESGSESESESSNNTNPTTANNLWESFIKFKNDLSSFFSINTEKFKRRTQRIRTALMNLFQNAFASECTSNTTNTTTTRILQMREDVKIFEHEPTAGPLRAQECKSELHTVLTADGYLLTLQRILPTTEHVNKKLVLLHHGLLGSSNDWLLLGPDRCLPCLLSRTGYDVWLANARGNSYSKSHINKTTLMHEFWDFSWHEIGLYDLPATIEYIKEYTNGELEMHFIGHSMGATALLVLLSVLPYHNEILRSAILLAPLAFMYNAKGLLRTIAEAYKRNDLNSLNFPETDEFMPSGMFPRQVIEKFCKGNERLCLHPLLLLANGGEEILDPNHVANILNYAQAGGSTKTIIHYGQLLTSGHFQMFDYGLNHNVERYGDYNPPKYNLKNVTLPVAIFSSRDDWLSTTHDVITLVQSLPNVITQQVIRQYGFSHTDFVWALDAPKHIYYQIFEIYKQFKVKK